MLFNLIDVFLVVLIGLNLLNGYRRGFILGALDLAGWVLSLLAGLRYSDAAELRPENVGAVAG